MASLKSNPMVKRLMETGEARVSKIVQQVLSNEKFVTAVQTVVQTTISAKGTLDKSLRTTLTAMNLPTSADLEQLREKVGELESLLSQLDTKVSQLLEQSSGNEPTSKRAKKKSDNASA